MFERFTKEAREAVVGAQRVARETGSRRIDSRHLLVALVEGASTLAPALQAAGVDARAVAGLARADLRAEGLDAEALADLGIDLDAVRSRAEAVFGPDALQRAGGARRGHIPFTADGRKAVELALREAIRLGQRGITAGHLLLGVVRADCPGRDVLERGGVDVAVLRSAVEQQSQAA